MAILKNRCPRCKREVKVHAVYSRSDYGNKVMKPIEGQYQCSVCNLCFNSTTLSDQCQKYLSEKYDHLRFEQLDCNMWLYLMEKTGISLLQDQLLDEVSKYVDLRQSPVVLHKDDDEVNELVTMLENEGKVR